MELKEKTGKLTIFVEDFKTPLERNDREKVSSNIEKLKATINQDYLIHIDKNTPSNDSIISTVYKFPWTIHQDRLYFESQKKPQQI